MDIAAAIAAGLGIVLLCLKQWQAGEQKRAQEKRNEEIQQGRQAVIDGDVAAISKRIDGLLVTSDPAADSDQREQSAEDIEGRIGKL